MEEGEGKGRRVTHQECGCDDPGDLRAASSGASSSKMVPQDIIKWVKPAPKIVVAPTMRKCISVDPLEVFR